MKFTRSHECIELQDNEGIVGIAPIARKELEPCINAQMPSIGDILRKGELACVLESNKSAVEIYSPVSGEVIMINDKPQNLEWLYKIRLSDIREYEALLTLEEYEKGISGAEEI